MSRVNRVLIHLDHGCRCHAARRQYAALKATCEAIEHDADGLIEFCVPSVHRLAGEKLSDVFVEDDDADDKPLAVRFFLDLSPDPSPLDADLRTYAVIELRRMADELTTAADAVEGGAL